MRNRIRAVADLRDLPKVLMIADPVPYTVHGIIRPCLIKRNHLMAGPGELGYDISSNHSRATGYDDFHPRSLSSSYRLRTPMSPPNRAQLHYSGEFRLT